MAKMVAALVALIGIMQLAEGCVYLMGEALDSVATHPGGTEWNYGFRGDDWNGVDAKNVSWVCMTGKAQTPINLVGYSKKTKSSKDLKTTWSYTPLKSNGSNIKVFNNGHTIQVQWLDPVKSKVDFVSTGNTVLDVLSEPSKTAIKHFQLTPLQFHFHTASEHVADGASYALEMHIVHTIPQSVLKGCPATGCLSVTGIMFKVADDINAHSDFLDAIWEVMPEREGVVDYMKAGKMLDIESLMPPKSRRGYMQYAGSLTTPPCTEGLLWHVLRTPMSISQAQYNQFAHAVGLKECTEVKTNTTGRRSALEHAHHDHAHSDVHERLASFQRGAYSGFVHADELRQAAATVPTVNRKLMAEVAGNKTYTCKVVSFGFNNRNLQPLNGRTVLAFA